MKTLTIRMRAADVAEIMLYDQIGADDFFGGGISAKTFREQLRSVKARTINLRINSPGGSVTEASAMLSALDEHPARIEVDIDGVAASAASVVAMAGDRIRVASNGLVMIHDPMTMTAGTSQDMRRAADLLDKVREQIIDAYARHSKAGRTQIAEWMAAETWFTGPEAVESGLAHEVVAPVQIAALAGHKSVMARLRYHHVPAPLRAAMAQANPLSLAVGDSVEWMSEDPDELCAELEDGVIEELSQGTLTIPGTSLSLTGSADDPAIRVIDQDEDDTTWYLLRASQVRGQGASQGAGSSSTPVPGARADGPAWRESRARASRLAELGVVGYSPDQERDEKGRFGSGGDGGAAPPPFRAEGAGRPPWAARGRLPER